MTVFGGRLPFRNWGVWWTHAKPFEEPGHWVIGGFRLTVHLGWWYVGVERRIVPPSLRAFHEKLERELHDVLKTLR